MKYETVFAVHVDEIEKEIEEVYGIKVNMRKNFFLQDYVNDCYLELYLDDDALCECETEEQRIIISHLRTLFAPANYILVDISW